MKNLREAYSTIHRWLPTGGMVLIVLFIFLYTLPANAQEKSCQEIKEKCILDGLGVLASEIGQAETNYHECLLGKDKRTCQAEWDAEKKAAGDKYLKAKRACELANAKCEAAKLDFSGGLIGG